jgi:hypothetical protein
MAWVNWSRKSTSESKRDRGCLGIDLNATRARAAAHSRVLLLDEPHADLPMAISMEKRTLEIGRTGVDLCRRLPHLACIGHLPHLGQPHEWKGGRHRLDAAGALALAFERLRSTCAHFDMIYLGLPAYLTLPQVSKLIAIAAKHRLALKGTAGSALAIAADRAGALLNDIPEDAAKHEDWIVPLRRAGKTPLPADAIVIDADEHALTASLIRIEMDQVRLLVTTALPRISEKQWKDRLLDSLSDRCVRVCRRDPRDSAEAEQSLHQQIDASLDDVRAGQKVIVTVRCAHWYQDLELQSDDLEGYCSKLIRQTIDGIRDLLNAGSQTEPPRAVWLTHEAGRLPGLARALHQNMAERTSVGVLRPEALAVALANLGERWQSGELPNSHLDTTIPIRLKLPESKMQTPPVLKSRL